MAKVTLYTDYKSGSAKEYAGAEKVAISPAGVLTFYWQEQVRSGKSKAYKFTTSVPFTVEEEIAAG